MSPAVAYRSLKTIQDYKTVTLEVIAVAYERCSFTRLVPTIRLWLKRIWCFGLVFAYERWSHMEIPLFLFVLIIIFWITISFYYVSLCYRSILNNIIISQVTV